MPYIFYSLNSISNTFIRVLLRLLITSRWLAAIPIGHNRQSTCGNTCYGSYTATPGRVPIYEHSPYSSQDYQTHQPTTEEGNLSGPIRTGHNQHTHTGHTRQPEPQLKGFSCSSAIPSHNSRDVIPSLNSRNTTCLTPIPSHHSRDTFRARTQGTPATSPLKHYQKPCRTPYEVQQLGLTAAKLPSGEHVPLGATASRSPGGGHVPPGTKRLINHKVCNYRLARPFPSPGGRCSRDHEFSPPSPGGIPLPPGASCTRTPLLPLYRLADLVLSPGAVSVLMQYWFWSITLCILPSHPSLVHYTPNSVQGMVHLGETVPLSHSITTL